ncbi:pyrimidine-nucleoside phosphorylase [Prosthecobacter fusiformis]|uniref:thymidine phosphorylase n=1 Tax=Prosthecobacter fusiformis TaxID=48464 RepID=A0A4R7RKB6_9BACT|nr:thymidine phosphorylase [Prosthecobacter fusiformis]TDU63192.1 pyrimidine-nucleoside phosphorylase [Prosthecobacter fusiformis]
MHIPSLIEAKRDGHALSAEQIRFLITAYAQGDMPDYQMSALAMAIFFKGMSGDETAALTEAMLRSGTVLHWPKDAPMRVDKHSTGGIGDKTSLILAPLLACDGLWVPMISGRGLGITGGTLDKLESIPGFRTQLSESEIYKTLPITGCLMVGQTANLCPADKKLYALRDVTGTIQSIPLLTSSIMGKKLAEGLNRLILDVKYGSGAFMQTREQAQALAESMVSVGRALGVRSSVRLSPMDEATGESAGNALEVIECLRCLQGQGPPDLENIVLDLACAVSISSRAELRQMLHDGRAYAKFQHMVTVQGGRVESLERLHKIHRAPVIHEMIADRSGHLRRLDAGTLGRAVLALGAGRAKATDRIDPAVGVDGLRKVGQEIQAGEVLLRIHARSQADAEEAEKAIAQGVDIR